MICSNCKIRYANFPDEDFDSRGIHAKNKEAAQRRLDKFNSDEVGYCGCIEAEEVSPQACSEVIEL